MPEEDPKDLVRRVKTGPRAAKGAAGDDSTRFASHFALRAAALSPPPEAVEAADLGQFPVPQHMRKRACWSALARLLRPLIGLSLRCWCSGLLAASGAMLDQAAGAQPLPRANGRGRHPCTGAEGAP